MPQECKHAPNRATSFYTLADDFETLFRREVHVIQEGAIHHDQWNLKEIGFTILFEEPRPVRKARAGSESDVIRKSD